MRGQPEHGTVLLLSSKISAVDYVQGRWLTPLLSLKEWAANPRKVRKLSTMQPVQLDKREWDVVRKMFEE